MSEESTKQNEEMVADLAAAGMEDLELGEEEQAMAQDAAAA